VTRPSHRFAEATALGAAGGVLAGLCWSSVGLGVPAAVVGGVNGVISGARATYSRDRIGALAFALDSTWALATTTASLGVHVVDGALRTPYLPEISRRMNRHVYRGGFTPRRGYAVTVGNVISSAGDVSVESRHRLVDEHEETHVWQARILGPLFAPAYLGWSAIGAVLGALRWITLSRPRPSLPSVVDRLAYRANPFERWAELHPIRRGSVRPIGR
jgi:hypothetical protein